jgi:hypothetical protein
MWWCSICIHCHCLRQPPVGASKRESKVQSCTCRQGLQGNDLLAVHSSKVLAPASIQVTAMLLYVASGMLELPCEEEAW